MNNTGELTQEEIRTLPIDLKVCFYLIGWNHDFNPKTVDDWIDCFYTYFGDENCSDNKSMAIAREEFNRLYQFIIKYVI
jgi:hypothetical protein